MCVLYEGFCAFEVGLFLCTYERLWLFVDFFVHVVCVSVFADGCAIVVEWVCLFCNGVAVFGEDV